MAGQVYQGAAGRGARYVGARTDAQLYLGAGTLFAAGVVPTLPISSVPFQVLYGHERVFPGYFGPIMRVSGGVGGGLYDVVQNADGTADTGAAYQAWLGGAEARVETWYDQTGNGRHAVQPDENARPFFTPEHSKNGKTPIFFGLGQLMYVPAEVTGNGRDTTVIAVNDRVTSATSVAGNLSEWRIGASWDAAGASSMLSAVPDGQRLLSTVFGNYDLFGRSQPETQIVSMYPDYSELMLGTAKGYTASGRAGTFTGGTIGTGGPGYLWFGSTFIWGVYASQLPEGERPAVQQALAASTNALTSWRAHLLSTGNSIVQGAGGAPGLNNLHFTEKLLDEPIAITNMGVFGQRLDTIVSQRAAYIGKFNFYIPINILVAPEPTNDIDQSGGDASYGQTCWDTLLLFVNDAIAAGWKVLVPTVIKRNWGSNFAAKEANRTFYNGKVRTALPAGAYFIDYAADDASLNLPDGTHPDTPSYRDLMAPRQAAAVSSLLAADKRDFRSPADFATLVDFKAGTGVVGFTAARASDGTATNAARDAVTAFGPNTLRRTDRGLLIEAAASSNVLTNGANVSLPPWDTYADDGGIISREQVADPGPDGTSGKVTKVTVTRGDSLNGFQEVYQNLSGLSGNHTAAYWIKAPTLADVGREVSLLLYSGTVVQMPRVALPEKWTRYTGPTRSGPIQIAAGNLPATGGWGGSFQTGSTSFLIALVQLEPGDIATSDMITGPRADETVSYAVPAQVDRLIISYESGDVSMLVTPGSTITLPRQGYATKIAAPPAAA